MLKSLFAISTAAASVMLFSISTAYSGTYPFGDAPYRLNWGYDPGIESGCLRWNWQQYGWDDYCPVYFHPKAYMFPGYSRAAVRSKS
jgi:hypothetical protein